MSVLQIADIGLGQTILRRAAISPEQPALTFEGETQSFAELGDRVRRMASVLRERRYKRWRSGGLYRA